MAEISEEDVRRAAIALAPAAWRMRGEPLDSIAQGSRRTASLKHARAAIEAFLSGSTEYRRGLEDAARSVESLSKCVGQNKSSPEWWLGMAADDIRALQPTER